MSYTLSQKSITNYMQTSKNKTLGYKKIKSIPSELLTLILLLTFNYPSLFTPHHYCNCAITQTCEKAPPCWTPFKAHVPLFSEASPSTHLQRRQTQGKSLASGDVTSKQGLNTQSASRVHSSTTTNRWLSTGEKLPAPHHFFPFQ